MKAWLPPPPVWTDFLPYYSYDERQQVFINQRTYGTVLAITPLANPHAHTDQLLQLLIADRFPPILTADILSVATPHIGSALSAFAGCRSQAADPIYRWLAEKRVAFLSDLATHWGDPPAPVLVRNWEYYLSLTMPQQAPSAQQIATLIQIRSDVMASLGSLGIACQILDPPGLLHIAGFLANPTPYTIDADDPHWDIWAPLRDQLIPQEQQLVVAPHALSFKTPQTPVEARVLGVSRFPAEWQSATMRELQGAFFHPYLQIPGTFAISVQLRTWEKNHAWSQATTQTWAREKTALSLLAQWIPGIRQEYQDWQCARTRLQAGETLVETSWKVIFWSHPQTADRTERKIKDVFHAQGWRLKQERYLQLPAYIGCFPMAAGEGLLGDLQYLGRTHTMTSGNVATMLPLVGESPGTTTPRMLLPSRQGQLVFWCPFDNPTGNYNMAITGSPGKGKSAFTQEYAMALLGSGGWVCVIDAGHSYEKTCRLLQGTFIDCGLDQPVAINPFGLIQRLTPETLGLLKSLLAYMAHPMTAAQESEYALLEQAIVETFQAHGPETTITQLVHQIRQYPGETPQNLAHLLYSYTRSGMYGAFFEGPCTWDLDNPFWVLELQNLKTKKTLQQVVLQVVIFMVFQKMYRSPRDQIKSCIIDEAWDLFDDPTQQNARFIETGYRTARKYRGNFVSITQSLLDYQKNSMARAAYDCADFKIILGQTPEAIERAWQDQLISADTDLRPLLHSLQMTQDYAECVIKGPDSIRCHRVVFDPYSKLLYSSRGPEYQAIHDRMAHGASCIEAMEQVMAASAADGRGV